MKQAVLLLSSGLDSAANLVLGSHFKTQIALTIDYGQRGAEAEIEHAGMLARHFDVEHVYFDFKNFSKLVGAQSSLLGPGAVPHPQSLDDLTETKKTAAAVWVPNRNAVLISLASALAESRGLGVVVVGFNAEEAVTFPDNTPEYMQAMTIAQRFSTANHVEVASATAMLTKSQIVKKLAEKEFPFELLWSCYQNGQKHCGRCESCQRLGRALKAGLPEERFVTVVKKIFSEDVFV